MTCGLVLQVGFGRTQILPRKFSGGQPFGKICKEKNKGALSAN